MIQQICLIECLNIFKISEKAIDFIRRTVENRRMEVAVGGQTQTEVII